MIFICGYSLAVVFVGLATVVGQQFIDDSKIKFADNDCICYHKESANKPKEECSDTIFSMQEENENLKKQIEELILTTGPAEKGNTNDIFQSAKEGNLPAIRFYVNQDPTSVNKKNQHDNYNTPMIFAAWNGHQEILAYLLAKGAEIDLTNVHLNTPLMHACNFGFPSVVEYLLDKGANINLQNIDNATALHWGVYGNRLEVVKLLIKKGANKYIKSNDGRTPLDEAKFKGRTPIVNYLLTVYKNK